MRFEVLCEICITLLHSQFLLRSPMKTTCIETTPPHPVTLDCPPTCRQHHWTCSRKIPAQGDNFESQMDTFVDAWGIWPIMSISTIHSIIHKYFEAYKINKSPVNKKLFRWEKLWWIYWEPLFYEENIFGRSGKLCLASRFWLKTSSLEIIVTHHWKEQI